MFWDFAFRCLSVLIATSREFVCCRFFPPLFSFSVCLLPEYIKSYEVGLHGALIKGCPRGTFFPHTLFGQSVCSSTNKAVLQKCATMVEGHPLPDNHWTRMVLSGFMLLQYYDLELMSTFWYSHKDIFKPWWEKKVWLIGHGSIISHFSHKIIALVLHFAWNKLSKKGEVLTDTG